MLHATLTAHAGASSLVAATRQQPTTALAVAGSSGSAAGVPVRMAYVADALTGGGYGRAETTLHLAATPGVGWHEGFVPLATAAVSVTLDNTLTTLQVTRGPTGVGRATAQVTGTRRHPGRSLAAASVTARVVSTHTQVATTTATATLTGTVTGVRRVPSLALTATAGCQAAVHAWQQAAGRSVATGSAASAPVTGLPTRYARAQGAALGGALGITPGRQHWAALTLAPGGVLGSALPGCHTHAARTLGTSPSGGTSHPVPYGDQHWATALGTLGAVLFRAAWARQHRASAAGITSAAGRGAAVVCHAGRADTSLGAVSATGTARVQYGAAVRATGTATGLSVPGNQQWAALTATSTAWGRAHGWQAVQGSTVAAAGATGGASALVAASYLDATILVGTLATVDGDAAVFYRDASDREFTRQDTSRELWRDY